MAGLKVSVSNAGAIARAAKPALRATTGTAPTPNARAADTAPRDASNFARFQQDQMDGVNGDNACGTTSLSMLLNFWKNQPGAYTHDKIDPVIREWGTFTTPEQVVDYAQSQGLRAVARNNSSLSDLLGFVDKGVPVQVLIDPTGTGVDIYLHYVDVVGTVKDKQGKVRALKIADPGNPAGSAPVTISLADFEKQWGHLRYKSVDTGVNNLMIPMLPKADVPVKGPDGVVRQTKDIALPPANNLGWRLAVVNWGANLKNDVAHLWRQLSAG
ncbi:MAG TPA: C39 family peptidase [Oscillatoriaceae cyanobacterium]